MLKKVVVICILLTVMFSSTCMAAPGEKISNILETPITVKSTSSGNSGGGGGGIPSPPTKTSKTIDSEIGGTINFDNISVEIPAGVLPNDATISIKKLTEDETNDIVPEGLQLKLGSNIYEITTTRDKNFGDNTITIKIPYDPNKIDNNEEPIINYYDEEIGEWIALETIIEQDSDGQWYAVVEVNHLTKFAVFSMAIQNLDKPLTIIKLTINSTKVTVNNESYIMDTIPYMDTQAKRVMVPIRFISEVLGAVIEWNPKTRQITIKDKDRDIIFTLNSKNVTINEEMVITDCAPIALPPGRTFVPLRFISEILGATVDYDNEIKQITITR